MSRLDLRCGMVSSAGLEFWFVIFWIQEHYKNLIIQWFWFVSLSFSVFLSHRQCLSVILSASYIMPVGATKDFLYVCLTE